MDDTILNFLQESNYIEGINSSWQLDNAVNAWKYISEYKEFSMRNILETHNILTKGELASSLRGSLRKVNVVIGPKRRKTFPVKYLPKVTRRWIEAANLTLMLKGQAPELQETEIKRDHVIFEHIHPFFDGNGRIGRILMNFQRTKLGLPILIITEGERGEYYKWFKTKKEIEDEEKERRESLERILSSL